MLKSIRYWQIVGFLFTAAGGTLLHFLFDLTGETAGAALISAVNESTWEHMKLLFYPMVLFALVEFFLWGSEFQSFWWIKLAGILMGLGLIPVMFYTYTGIWGISVDWINILIFFIAAGVSFWVETRLFQADLSCHITPIPAFILICLLAGLFVRFTFSPPRIPLFQDPLTGTYGLQRQEWPEDGSAAKNMERFFCLRQRSQKGLSKRNLPVEDCILFTKHNELPWNVVISMNNVIQFQILVPVLPFFGSGFAAFLGCIPVENAL